jgi:hypothetical protein
MLASMGQYADLFRQGDELETPAHHNVGAYSPPPPSKIPPGNYIFTSSKRMENNSSTAMAEERRIPS